MVSILFAETLSEPTGHPYDRFPPAADKCSVRGANPAVVSKIDVLSQFQGVVNVDADFTGGRR